MRYVRYLACRLIGNALTDWYPVVTVTDTFPESFTVTYSTNASLQCRYCLRCSSAYEVRGYEVTAR